jgi:nitrous-oxide reductase
VHASVEPGKTVHGQVQGRQGRRLPVLLHRVLLGAAPRDAGLPAGQAEGLEADQDLAGTAGANYTEADYKTQLKKVADTQAVIDSVVGYITSVNYKDFPDVVAMMDDAVDQLGKIKDAKAKADEAAAKKDWNNAALWTEQIWQYQVKAADLGLRAKTYLEQNGAKKIK